MTRRLLPAEPLAELVREAVGHRPDGIACLASDAGVSTRTLTRILCPGHRLSLGVADKVTIALSRHPDEVWGMEWSA